MARKSFIWLLAITILVVVAVVIWMVVNSGGIINNYSRPAYYTIKSQIQNAVTDFAANHNGSLPSCEDTPFNVNFTYSNASTVSITCQVVDLCSLIGTGQLLRTVPDGLYGNSSQEHTNFYNSSNVYYEDGCKNPLNDWGHYIYLIDSIGNVYSICDENRDGVYNSSDRVDGLHPIGKYASQDIIWP